MSCIRLLFCTLLLHTTTPILTGMDALHGYSTLVSCSAGYPAVLFAPFSRYIAENKDAYYKAYERVERNALISGYTDVTPFLFYFCNEVYNRLQVDAVPPKTDLEVYQTALAEGKITEKERLLWEYVLSAYGAEEFTTKQLEKDSETLRMQPFGRL